MHTLEHELRLLQAEGVIDAGTASRAVAADRREPFSVHNELRLAMYAGVLLVLGGVGMVLARNLDRIGPLAIALGLALAAVVCTIPAVRHRLRVVHSMSQPITCFCSGRCLQAQTLAYVEAQFKLLGPLWSWHLLWLAFAHAVLAYTFRSTLVLAASLTSLAGWFGAGSTMGAVMLSYTSPEVGARALACAAVFAAWRYVDLRLRPATQFSGTFDHFAANLAFVGAVAWCVDWPWLAAGLPLLAGLALVSIRHAFNTGREAFLVYGVLYAALGFCVAVVPHVNDFTAACALVLLVVCGAATAIWQMRQQ